MASITLDHQGSARFQRAPLLTSTGAPAGPVIAGQTELSLSNVRAYTVATNELVAGAGGEVVGSNLTDLALEPGNTTLYSAAGSRNQVDAFSSTDLSRLGAYATGPYPNSVAPSPDGRYLATGIFTSRAQAISIYPVGTSAPRKQITADGLVLASRGLAWSGDSNRLFAIFQAVTNPRPRLASFTF
jgi:hypothetical protein